MNQIMPKTRIFRLHFCCRHCGYSISQFKIVGSESCHFGRTDTK